MKKLLMIKMLIVITVSALYSAPCPAPTDITFAESQYNADVVVSWTPPDQEPRNFEVKWYDYKGNLTKTTTTDLTTITISDFIDVGEYKVEVSTFCGTDYYSAILSGVFKRTKIVVPKLPYNISAEYIKGDNVVYVKWDYNYAGFVFYTVDRYDANHELITSEYLYEKTYTDYNAGTDKYYYYISVYDEAQKFICRSVEYAYVMIKDCDVSFSSNIINPNDSKYIQVEYTPTVTNIDKFYWKFGDGNSKEIAEIAPVINIYNVPGEYTVTVWGTNSTTGCNTSFTQNVIVGNFAPVTAGFTYKVFPDENSITITSTAPQGATNVYYNYGDGTGDTRDESHIYSEPGEYKVYQYTSNDDKSLTDEHLEIVLVGKSDCDIRPSFIIYPSDNNSIKIENATFGAGAYYWDFGDGNASKEETPYYTYRKPGYYLVTLSVQNKDFTCSNSYSAYVQVGQMDCKANFDYFVDPITTDVTFTSKSLNSAYNYWSFGDGGYEKGDRVSYKYKYNGRYIVSLSIADSENLCSDYFEKEIQVGELFCNAKFTYFVNSDTKTITLKNSAKGENVRLYWDFGDGNYSEKFNPEHEYKSDGYYYISLYTYDEASNCYDSYSENVVIGSTDNDCEAYFYYRPDVTYKNLTFTDASFGRNIYKRVWNFGDGTRESSAYDTITHYYEKDGYYDVCLTIVNDLGFSNMTCYSIFVGTDLKYNCESKFVSVVDSVTNTVKFCDKSEGIDNNTTYEWYFGDEKGIIGTTSDYAYTYDKPDYYVIWHRITTGTGCDSWAYEYINVGMPNTYSCSFIAKVNATQTKATGYPVDFVGVGMGDNARLKWDFGDGETDTTTNSPTHYYTDGLDVHQVCYTVSDPITEEEATYCSYIDKNGNEVGIDKNTKNATNKALVVSPNPFEGLLRIAANTTLGGNYVVSVTDVTGRVLQQINSSTAAGNFDVNINTSAIENGTYIVKITTPDNKSFNRVVVKK